jgi:hypothetical protein
LRRADAVQPTRRPPSRWQSYRVDGNGDGRLDPYDPADAIASAAHYLKALLDSASGDVSAAVYGYNHARAYVTDVLSRARAYTEAHAIEVAPTTGDSAATAAVCGSAGESAGVPAYLRYARRRTEPRAYSALPAWAMAAGRAPGLIDARLLDDTLWRLHRYALRVTAAREAGHNTHGDGTALDLVPAHPSTDRPGTPRPALWPAISAGHARAPPPACARCARSSRRSSSSATRAPGHGSPRACSGACAAHLHVSFVSPCYGRSAPSTPCAWVMGFTHGAGPPGGSRPDATAESAAYAG